MKPQKSSHKSQIFGSRKSKVKKNFLGNKKIFFIFISVFLLILISEFVYAEIVTINPNIAYPGDTITINIRPNKKFGFYNIISVMKDADVVDLITVSCATICKQNRVVYYTIPSNFLGQYYFATFDYAVNDYELDYFNVIEPGGAPAGQFTELSINNVESGINLIVNPEQGEHANITITTLLNVKNCQNYNVFAYLCDLKLISQCSDLQYTHKIPLVLAIRIRNNCWFNYTGNDYFPFYYPGGDWTILAKSGIVEITKNFTYSELIAINYSSLINFGTLNAKVWNVGVPQDSIDLINFGNVPLMIDWNSTGFSCIDPGCMDNWLTYYESTDEYTFQIDDDNLFLEQIETGLQPVFITNFTTNYFPQAQLSVCASDNCDNNIGERVKTFFNLKIPDIQRGVYEGGIKITAYIA